MDNRFNFHKNRNDKDFEGCSFSSWFGYLKKFHDELENIQISSHLYNKLLANHEHQYTNFSDEKKSMISTNLKIYFLVIKITIIILILKMIKKIKRFNTKRWRRRNWSYTTYATTRRWWRRRKKNKIIKNCNFKQIIN